MAKKKQSDNAVIIWTIIALIAVFIISHLIFKGLGTIEYQGLTFTKEMFGKIPVYHYAYVYADKSGQLMQNNIYLRNNPKKNDVESEGDIAYLPNKFTYITINATALTGCNQSGVAISSLASFIANGGIQVRGGSMENDNHTGINNGTLYVTCERFPYNPVIQIQPGNETKIVNENLCYNIYFAQCSDVLPAVEKFIVESIVQAKEARSEKSQ